VFWRGVLEELLWFISGSTNAKVLEYIFYLRTSEIYILQRHFVGVLAMMVKAKVVHFPQRGVCTPLGTEMFLIKDVS
jgi:hypothetical protein